MKQVVDIEDCYKRIKKMCQRMNKEIIFNDSFLKKMYKRIFDRPKLLRFKILFNRLRKSFIRIHLNRKEICIYLFNKILLGGGNQDAQN